MTGQERTMAERRDEVFNARAALHEAIEMLQRAERFRAVVPLRERANEVAKVALRINVVINWFEDAVHAAALADQEAEVRRKDEALRLAENRMSLRTFPEDWTREQMRWVIDQDLPVLRVVRAALSGDTLRSSGEEEATG